jgi:CrcB protein
MTKYWLVAIGGAVGSVLRFWVHNFVGERVGGRFPWGTFVINVSASFLIGLVVAVLAQRNGWSANWVYLIAVEIGGGPWLDGRGSPKHLLTPTSKKNQRTQLWKRGQ